MVKNLFSYFLIIILSIHITLPICMSFFDITSEVSFVIDLDEELEDTEISKDYEVKILHTSNIYVNFKKTKYQDPIIFFTKKYNSIFQKLDSPPPEFIC